MPGNEHSGGRSGARHGEEGAHESAAVGCSLFANSWDVGSICFFLCSSWVSQFPFLVSNVNTIFLIHVQSYLVRSSTNSHLNS